MKILRYFLYFILLILLAVGGVFAWLVGSNAGMSFVLDQVPGLQVQDAQGRLWDDAKLNGVEFQQGEMRVVVAQAGLQWRPLSLFERRLHVAELSSREIEVFLPPPAATTAPEPSAKPQIPDISLPLDIQIDGIRVKTIKVHQGEALHIVNAIDLEVATQRSANRVEIAQFTVSTPDIQLSLAGTLGLHAPHPLDLTLSASVDQAALGQASADIAVQGDTQHLTATIRAGLLPAEHLPQAEIVATVTDVLGDLGWQAKVTVQNVDTAHLQHLAAGAPPLQAALRINAKGDLRQVSADADMALNSPDFGAFDLKLQAGGTHPQWVIDTFSLTQADTFSPSFGDDALLGFLDNLNLPGDPHKLNLNLRGKADLSDASQPAFEAQLDWHALRWPLRGDEIQAASPEGRLTLSGTPAAYQLNVATRAEGGQVPPSRWQLAGQGNLSQFELSQLHGELLNGELNASAQVAWQPELKVDAKLSGNGIQPQQYMADWPASVAVDFELAAELLGQAFNVSGLRIALPGNGAELKLSAKGKTDASDLQADIQWTQLGWPLAGAAQFSSPTGEVKLTGSKDDYQLALQTQVAGQDIPSGTWALQGHGSPTFFNINQLRGDTLGGALTSKGRVAWNISPQIPVEWELQLDGDKLKPGVQWKDLSGHVSWHLNTQGKLMNGKPFALVKIPDLKGELQGYPLKLQADVEADDKGYHIRQLDFQSAGAKLSAQGLVGEVLNLRWDLNVPALNKLLPKASGVIVSTGKLSGSPQQPLVQASVKANDVRFQELRVNKVDMDANLDLHEDAPLTLKLDVSGVKQAAQRIDSVKLRLDGRTSQHKLTLAVVAPQAKLDVGLQGGMNIQAQSWRGALEKLRLDGGEFGTWALKQAASLAVSAKQAQLGESCLVSQKTALCAELDWQAAGSTLAKLNLDNFDLVRLAPILPENLSISGVIGADIAAQLPPCAMVASANSGQDKPSCAPQADVKLTLTPGAFKTTLEDGTPLAIPHQGAHLIATADASGGKVDLDFTFQQHDQIKAQVSLPGLSLPPADAQPLAGQVTVDISDFQILNALVTDISKAKGTLKAQVDLGGSLAKPRIEGNLKLSDGAMDIAVAGLELRELGLNIKADANNHIDLSGGVKSGKDGVMRLAGAFQPSDKGAWQGHLNIDGKDFEALNTPDGWVFLQPALRIKLAPKHLHIGGELSIPRAELTPQGAGGSGGSVVQVSDDVVIIQEQVEEADAEPVPDDGFVVSSDVRVNLGDKVRVEAEGFKGFVSGHLQARSEANQAPRGTGEIVVKGTYKSYGQDLTVDKGTVAFNNSPLDNPILNMRATRFHEGDQVTTGVKVRGTAQDPSLELFSEPAMDQANALAYLVLGGPLGTGSKTGDSDTLMRAAAALPLGKSGFLTRQIAREFGLDEARISGEGNLELGKYLTPRLYLKYTSSLFDPGQVLKLRYRLTKHLHLETQAGTETGADLLYSLER